MTNNNYQWNMVAPDMVQLVEFNRPPQNYTYEAICFAIETIKSRKESYASSEFYSNHLAMFEHGRGLFNRRFNGIIN